jgi:hypothetical protein
MADLAGDLTTDGIETLGPGKIYTISGGSNVAWRLPYITGLASGTAIEMIVDVNSASPSAKISALIYDAGDVIIGYGELSAPVPGLNSIPLTLQPAVVNGVELGRVGLWGNEYIDLNSYTGYGERYYSIQTIAYVSTNPGNYVEDGANGELSAFAWMLRSAGGASSLVGRRRGAWRKLLNF